MHSLLKLEMHAAHACNFTCESCSHFSNNAHKGIITPEEADRQMGLWSHKLNPTIFAVLGGEPFINPRIEDFMRVTRKHWKNCVELISNGFLIPKFPNFGKIVDELGINLIITRHHDSKEYVSKLNEVFKFMADHKIKYTMRETLGEFENPTDGWTYRYKGFGPNVMPYEDGRPDLSWEICHCKYCPQILDGKIYKCPIMAYLRVQKERWPNISEKWDKYLAYKPLESTATDEEMINFLSRKVEDVCGACPSETEHFQKPSPLITIGELLTKLSS